MIDLKPFIEIKDLLVSELTKELSSEETSNIFNTCVKRYMNPSKNPGGKSTSQKLYINRGLLINSLKKGNQNNIWKVSIKDNDVILEVGSTLSYAAIHEEGNSYMPKRPYLKPALQLFNEKYLGEIVNKVINKIQK